jgi:hypothetical protein
VVLIPLYAKDGSIRGYTKVDATDADWVNQWRWCMNVKKNNLPLAYAKRAEWRGGNRTDIFLHRALLGLPDRCGDIQVDHINHDGLDNRRCNLRKVTARENAQNRRKCEIRKFSRTTKDKIHTSLYRGVHWAKHANKWRAEGRISGHCYHIGYFINEEDAAKAATEWRRQYMPYTQEVA